MIRSYLFVPGDSERKMEKALRSGADALILDLEDSVHEESRPLAREFVKEFLLAGNARHCWVRINALDTPDAELDLAVVMAGAPEGIVLPKPTGVADSRRLSQLLEPLEAKNGVAVGSTHILPITTERPRALFSMGDYRAATPRLAGLCWGAEDLSAAIGASATRDEEGNWLAPYQLARSLCLFAAASAGVDAIDTVYTDFRDATGLAKYASAARRDGFSGMLAIHPAQVAIINKAFSPTAEEIAHAQRIVDLFTENPDAGVIGLDGEMLDRPHLIKAKNLLELTARLGDNG